MNIISSIVKVAAILFVIFMPLKETSAANWIYLQRHEGTIFGAGTEYMDADSVVKANKIITYWNVLVFDEKEPRNKIKTILFKKKADMTAIPLKNTILEQYFFDINGDEVKHDLKPVVSGWKRTDEVNRAIGYAENTYTSDNPRPNHMAIPKPKWHYYGVCGNSEIYGDESAIVVWPKDKPTTIDVRLKQVWNAAGIEQRKNFLATKAPYSYNDDNDVNYTVVSCQLLLAKSKLRILEVTDYDRDGNRITLLDGTDWKDIKQGTLEELIQSIALSKVTKKDKKH